MRKKISFFKQFLKYKKITEKITGAAMKVHKHWVVVPGSNLTKRAEVEFE